MASQPTPSALKLTPHEQAQVDAGMAQIRQALKAHHIDVKSIIGLATTDDLKETTAAVEVRLAEETVVNVQMNMVSFD